MIELLFVLLISSIIAMWWQLMQGRQKARRVAGQVCAIHELQLLDDTVTFSSVSWDREHPGPHLLINYSFEFTTNGARRRRGVAALGVPGSVTVSLDLEHGRLL